MKKLLRGIKSSVDRKVDNWLHKEEREAHQQQMEEALAKLDAEIAHIMQPVKEFIDATLQEDLNIAPTGRDIDRYFHIYQGAMEGKKKLMEKAGIWTQDADEPILTSEQYEEKAKADGWKFLRTSVGLPLCDLNKPRPDAWRTPPAKPHSVPQPEGWDAQEKSVDSEEQV